MIHAAQLGRTVRTSATPLKVQMQGRCFICIRIRQKERQLTAKAMEFIRDLVPILRQDFACQHADQQGLVYGSHALADSFTAPKSLKIRKTENTRLRAELSYHCKESHIHGTMVFRLYFTLPAKHRPDATMSARERALVPYYI